MDFENYANRILALNDCDVIEKPKTDIKQVQRLTVIDGEMQQRTVTKTIFFQFDDKRFYFSDCITLLPLSHSFLQDLKYPKEEKVKGYKKSFCKKKINCMQRKTKLGC